MTPEAANQRLAQLLETGEGQEQSVMPEERSAGKHKRPLRWNEFLTVLSQYCAYRGWQLIYDSPTDYSCMILAQEDQDTDKIEVRQAHLPFADWDGLPF